MTQGGSVLHLGSSFLLRFMLFGFTFQIKNDLKGRFMSVSRNIMR